MSAVVVIGSINMDVVTHCERRPRPGETVQGTSVRLTPGGKGANQAVAARRFGVPAALVGAVGDDGFAHQLRAFLHAEDIDLSSVAGVRGPSGTAVIMVDATGENSITIMAGANATVAPRAVTTTPIFSGDVVLLQNEIPEPANAAAIARARAAGAATVLNLAPYRPTDPALLRAVDHLIVNETEFASLTGHGSQPLTPDQVADLLAANAGPPGTVIVTLGADGLLARLGDSLVRVAGHPVEAVDTTGAGDCFCGVFSAALARGDRPADALRYASAAAALSVRAPGAAPSMPSAAAVHHFLQTGVAP